MKKYKKSMGGQLLQTGVSFIPGVGQILSPLVGMVDQQMEKDKLEAEQLSQVPPIKITTNPYGKFAKGGILNDMFKQYNTGSHASGNDLAVDSNGNPDPNGPNSVQGKENSYRVDGDVTVMSNVLKNPKTGNKFSTDALKINNKYPDARTSLDERAALDFEMKRLSKLNDAIRVIDDNKQKFLGGTLGKDAIKYAIENQGVPLASPNMFVSNLPSLGIDPLPTYSIPDNTSLATDTTVPQEQQMILGRDLTAPGNQSNVLAPRNQGSDVLGIKSDDRSSDVLGAKAGNAVALGMKGIALGGSIYDALQPAQQENLVLPDYAKSDAYMQSANVDYTQAKQDAVGVSNIGGNINRSLSGNAAAFQGREQGRLAQLQDSLGRISEGENLARTQLNLTKGQYEQGKAVDTANRTYQNNTDNLQNQANSRFFDRTLMSDLSQAGSSFNSYSETQKVIGNNAEINKFNTTQALSILQTKYPGWQIDPSIMEQFKSGKIGMDEFLKYAPGGFSEELKKEKD